MFRTLSLTLLALLAFAGNSVLCRLALQENVIDALSFTSIRLISGSVFLVLLVASRSRKMKSLAGGSWLSALYLFVYALTFSLAYMTLDTGTGALILFGSVQVTMIVSAFIMGHKPNPMEWAGLFVAFTGLTVLLLPSAASPSLSGFTLMVASGVAWGFYTIAGKGSKTPLIDTASNFSRTLPFVVVATLLNYSEAELSSYGVALAMVSGALTSGLGYAIWYAALAGLTTTRAAVFQLAVPVIAALGGVVFSNESISIRLVFSSILVLGGVLFVLLARPGKAQLSAGKR